VFSIFLNTSLDAVQSISAVACLVFEDGCLQGHSTVDWQALAIVSEEPAVSIIRMM
jgi:hypothetical protein